MRFKLFIPLLLTQSALAMDPNLSSPRVGDAPDSRSAPATTQHQPPAVFIFGAGANQQPPAPFQGFSFNSGTFSSGTFVVEPAAGFQFTSLNPEALRTSHSKSDDLRGDNLRTVSYGGTLFNSDPPGGWMQRGSAYNPKEPEEFEEEDPFELVKRPAAQVEGSLDPSTQDSSRDGLRKRLRRSDPDQ